MGGTESKSISEIYKCENRSKHTPHHGSFLVADLLCSDQAFIVLMCKFLFCSECLGSPYRGKDFFGNCRCCRIFCDDFGGKFCNHTSSTDDPADSCDVSCT